jgi:phosphotransferase system HPr (HPr) family protein
LTCQAIARLNNRLGLHLRAAARLVKTASQFQSRIFISYGPQIANAKSLLALLTLAVSYGVDVRILTEGDDAAQALYAVKNLIENEISRYV